MFARPYTFLSSSSRIANRFEDMTSKPCCWLDCGCAAGLSFGHRRKTQGINAIGGILNKSRTLLVAWDRTYFSRLWCSFELAAFYHSKLYDSKAAGKVVLLPIILGKVISEIAACTWALELLRIHMPFNAGLRSAALLLASWSNFVHNSSC